MFGTGLSQASWDLNAVSIRSAVFSQGPRLEALFNWRPHLQRFPSQPQETTRHKRNHQEHHVSRGTARLVGRADRAGEQEEKRKRDNKDVAKDNKDKKVKKDKDKKRGKDEKSQKAGGKKKKKRGLSSSSVSTVSRGRKRAKALCEKQKSGAAFPGSGPPELRPPIPGLFPTSDTVGRSVRSRICFRAILSRELRGTRVVRTMGPKKLFWRDVPFQGVFLIEFRALGVLVQR